MGDLLASLMVRVVNVLFHLMPIRLNLWLARRLGVLAYYLSGRRKQIAYANLKAAFSKEKTPYEIKHIAKNVYVQAAQTFAELLSLTKVNTQYLEKYIKFRHRDRLEKASKNSKGLIFISAHFGSWELMIATSITIGHPLHILARDQKMKRLNELLHRIRESKGNTVIRKGMDIKNIFQVLRRGDSIGILGDQNAGPTGTLLDFFGRPASTAIGPYRFAQKTGAWVLPAFMHRVKGPYHEVVLEEPMIIGKNEDITPYAQAYNRLLEKHVREDPDQWFWMHKKWKMTPVKKIMVLDDDKKGHLKQSLAVVKQIKRYREKEGFSPDQTKVDIVDIKFKNKTAKAVLNFLSPFFTSRCQGRMWLLKWALERESYKNAIERYGDVVISCGSALFSVNRLLKMENHARNLTVLDPGWLNRGKFDLVVIPRHDVSAKKAQAKNVIVTDLAPNLIRTAELEPFRDKMKAEQSLKYNVNIGLILGGDNPHYHFSEALSRSLTSGIKEACERLNGGLYVTTSRRTPDAAEAIMKDTFEADPRCMKFVSGKSDRDEHTVEKILAASDLILVSGESISMVSEAVSSGRPVLVFMPDKRKNRSTKYERFVKNLEEKKYLKLVDPEKIPQEAELAIGGKSEHALPEDDDRILEKMYKLF
ncbi:MAG: ELM1/GtrOC1 family putative glycosyltransferase [Candidatus Omnitrophota bacterium]